MGVVAGGQMRDRVEITAVKMAVQCKRGLIALGQHVRGRDMLGPIRATWGKSALIRE